MKEELKKQPCGLFTTEDCKNKAIDDANSITDLQDVRNNFFIGERVQYLIDWEYEIRDRDAFDS